MMVRINKFTVPLTARDEFCDVVARTHAVLRTVNGYVRDQILETTVDDEWSSIVTMIEFSGPDVIDNAVGAVAAFDRQNGIDRKALMARLGVGAEMGLYTRLEL